MPTSGRALPAVVIEAAILEWLLVALQPTNRTRVKQLLRHGLVAVNGSAVSRHDHVLRPGDIVMIGHSTPGKRDLDRVGIRIVYEDEAVIVVDKPAGLLSVATEGEKEDTAFARLNAARGERPFVVHRLDRDTSGLLLFARTAAARDRLQAAWESVEKTYLAIVEGVPVPAEGVIENCLREGRDLRVRPGSEAEGAKRAVSRFRVLTPRGKYTLVEVGLITGRKHQIRVHLAGLGCPVIGDTAYGSKLNPARRLGLHAWKLAFAHPHTGTRVELESPLPEVLRRVVDWVSDASQKRPAPRADASAKRR